MCVVYRLHSIHCARCVFLCQSVDRDSLAGGGRFLGIFCWSYSLPRLLVSVPYRPLPLRTSRIYFWKVRASLRTCLVGSALVFKIVDFFSAFAFPSMFS